MQIEIIAASMLMHFQQRLRTQGLLLIRAKPFRNSDGNDCYSMMFIKT